MGLRAARLKSVAASAGNAAAARSAAAHNPNRSSLSEEPPSIEHDDNESYHGSPRTASFGRPSGNKMAWSAEDDFDEFEDSVVLVDSQSPEIQSVGMHSGISLAIKKLTIRERNVNEL